MQCRIKIRKRLFFFNLVQETQKLSSAFIRTPLVPSGGQDQRGPITQWSYSANAAVSLPADSVWTAALCWLPAGGSG